MQEKIIKMATYYRLRLLILNNQKEEYKKEEICDLIDKFAMKEYCNQQDLCQQDGMYAKKK